MHTGEIHLDSINGGIDLRNTLESGQTFLWRRSDGGMFSDDPPGDAWYETAFVPGDDEHPLILRVRRDDDALVWRSNVDAASLIRSLLRLDDDLERIRHSLLDQGDDPLLEAALSEQRGLRVVNDPAFPCLISFICSPQMRVPRIHRMQIELAERFGRTVRFDGRQWNIYPTPTDLAAVSKDELLDAGLGYRARYVARTAEMVAGGEAVPRDAVGLPYEDAREELKQFVGVGDKVADCVLLMSLGYLQSVPVDTWVQRAIEEHYPACACDDYGETSRAIRERWGEYAGYAQAYVFRHLRTTEGE